ncbi:MAG: thiamine pyrophosphate-binding protein [Methylobacteriaceae bacterium]|nr:thiamine pyrophosphate-binding protein [Methylobacteriaceae bacterium]
MIRGADILARALDRAGLTNIFTLSGNHIMPIFDAAIGTRLNLIHVRHEGAAVHMADAWGRLSGMPGLALVTAGPGHANAIGALATAQAAESPLILLSGHAAIGEIGRGAFQEMQQAATAAPLCKAAWVAASAEGLGHDIAHAVSIARSGRPGPVHVSLPFDVLEMKVEEGARLWPAEADFEPSRTVLPGDRADAILAALEEAERPLILAGAAMADIGGRALLRSVAVSTRVPAVLMESPRGIKDPSLGALAEMLRQADLLVLLGKPHDFTLRFAEPPFVDPGCRFIAVDPDRAMLDRVRGEKGARLMLSTIAEPHAAARVLSEMAHRSDRRLDWFHQVGTALAYRPPEWDAPRPRDAKVHPIDFCRAIQPLLAGDEEAVFVCDGGEIGQWAQALLEAPRRLINGVAGSIGSAIPFALTARLFEPRAPVIAVMGDGTFGFHMAEFDTAVRRDLPFVAVIGNDATWNAEYQIQLRSYGEARAHGCDLLPSRYDKVVEALGGHGEFVERVDDLAPALHRALASGKPACVNVMIERVGAPVIRRESA